MCCKDLADKLKADPKCFEHKTSASEKKSKISLKKTTAAICRIRVDKCLFTDQVTKRCDVAFVASNGDKNKLHAILPVELKGTDLKDAFDQLDASIRYFNGSGVFEPIEKAVIIGQPVPKGNQKIEKLKRAFRKNHRATVDIKRNGIDYRWPE